MPPQLLKEISPRAVNRLTAAGRAATQETRAEAIATTLKSLANILKSVGVDLKTKSEEVYKEQTIVGVKRR